MLKAALLACDFYRTRWDSCFPTLVDEVPRPGGSVSKRGAALTRGRHLAGRS